MTKAEMKEMVKSCIEQRNLCRMFLRYHENYWYYFPLISNDKLFLGAEEDDFIIDGYSIRRYVDITKVQIKDDMCIKILQSEGVIDSIKTPNVDISSWETVFTSLQKMNINVIVENESLNEDECDFTIGKIDRVFKKCVYIYHFDAEGIWNNEPYRIPYTDITSVSFGTRYVETFSKYLSEPPRK
jgi:hypothetical protein